jgi:hypothetical protein
MTINIRLGMMAAHIFQLKRTKTESTGQSDFSEPHANALFIGINTDISDADSTLSLDSALFSTATPRIASKTSISSRFQGLFASMRNPPPNHQLPSIIYMDTRNLDSISEPSLDFNILMSKSYHQEPHQLPRYYAAGRSVYQSDRSSRDSNISTHSAINSLAATNGSTQTNENPIENTRLRTTRILGQVFQGVFTHMRSRSC